MAQSWTSKWGGGLVAEWAECSCRPGKEVEGHGGIREGGGSQGGVGRTFCRSRHFRSGFWVPWHGVTLGWLPLHFVLSRLVCVSAEGRLGSPETVTERSATDRNPR